MLDRLHSDCRMQLRISVDAERSGSYFSTPPGQRHKSLAMSKVCDAEPRHPTENKYASSNVHLRFNSTRIQEFSDTRKVEHQQGKDSLPRVLRPPRYRCQKTNFEDSDILNYVRNTLGTVGTLVKLQNTIAEWRPPQQLAWHIGILQTTNCTAP